MAARLRSQNKLRTIPAAREDGSADAVILHGMKSCRENMIQITRALKSRGHYRHIARFDLGLAHKLVPQIIAKKTAERIAATKVRPALARGRLTAPIDLLGHSNGGYVCLFLAMELGPSLVRSVFTIGTPRGISLLQYQVPTRIKLYHLRGGYDGVPFGGEHNPGDGEWVVTFPEERHSSLHVASDSNGVADVIMFLAGKRPASVFVDESGKMHPWQFCREEANQGSVDALRYLRKLEVCDGMHDTCLTKSKRKRDTIKGREGLMKSMRSVAPRISSFLEIRERLAHRQAALEEEAKLLRGFGAAAREDLHQLKQETEELQKRTNLFDKRIKQFLAAFREDCGHEITQLTDALSVCEQLAQGQSFGNREVAEVNGLLRLALSSHRRLNKTIQGCAGISLAAPKFRLLNE